MNEKIDLTKILKDCPKGMELDSTVFNGVVTFNGIINDEQYPIEIKIDNIYKEYLDKYGRFLDRSHCKCVIFPKGKTTWEGFVPPCNFKDGDIVRYGDCIAIFNGWGDETLFRTYVTVYLHGDSTIDVAIPLFGKAIRRETRFATEEEKQKLFDTIKANGYKWNAETKVLEKLIVPKFKIGDTIQSKNDNKYKFTITIINNNEFYHGCGKNGYGKMCEFMIPVVKQDNWELVPNKFDPETLKPFDKVLVRHASKYNWYAALFSHVDDLKSSCYKFVTTAGISYKYMIPYNEETKHLLGTNNEAPEFYILKGE